MQGCHNRGPWREGLAVKPGEDREVFPRSHRELEVTPKFGAGSSPPATLVLAKRGCASLWEAGMSPANALLQECPGSAWLSLFFLCLLFVCLIWFQIINCKHPWLMV